jgi:serine phosphatase RsbU (regulator of sigma subunit)
VGAARRRGGETIGRARIIVDARDHREPASRIGFGLLIDSRPMSGRPITIRSRLVRDLTVLVVGLGVVTSAVLFLGGRRAVRTLAGVVMSQTLATTESRMDGFFGGVEHQLGIIQRQVSGPGFDGGTAEADPERALETTRTRRNELFAPVIAVSPEVSSIILADERGREHMLLRDGDGWRNRLVAADEWPAVRWYDWTGDETPVRSQEMIDYDPRERPWFRGAIAGDADQLHWTDPYIFFTSRQLGITVSGRFEDADGLTRVAAIDVLLRDITEFTRTLAVGERGVASVLTGDGRMLGLPGVPEFDDPAARRAAYLKAPEELGLRIIDDAIAVRRTRELDGRTVFRFTSGGEAWWGATEPYTLSSGLPLRVAVLIPEAELLGDLVLVRMIVLGVVGVVLILGVLRVASLARRFGAPIAAVAHASERITTGDLEPGPPIESRFTEIRRLVEAQEHMRAGIAASMKLQKIERDLDIAREIQSGLLPTIRPDSAGFRVAGWNRPADETGGDFYDWMTLPDGRILIALADATGHGIGPALMTVVCRAYMRAAVTGDDITLVGAIARVNDLLHADLPDARFVTAAIGVLNPATHTLSMVSAGQAPIFMRRADGTCEVWDADVPPLGIMNGMPMEKPRKVVFAPGDTLVITTDGFFEWANAADEQYGIERLEQFVTARAGDEPDAFIAALEAEVGRHAAGEPQPDDLTVLVVQRAIED